MQLDTARLREIMPFGELLGLDLVEARPDRVVASLAWEPSRTTSGGAMHGGVLMGLADSVGAVVAFLNLPEGAGTSTISSNTVFLRGVRDGVVTATGRALHVGRSTIVVETEVVHDGRVATRTTQTQAVLRPTGSASSPPATG